MLTRSFKKSLTFGAASVLSLWQMSAFAAQTPIVYYDMGNRGTAAVDTIANKGSLAGFTANTPAGNMEIFATDPALGTFDKGTCGYAHVNGQTNYLDAGNGSLGLTTAVTVAAWVRVGIDPVTGVTNMTILAQQNNGTTSEDTPFILRLDGGNPRHFVFTVYGATAGKALTSKTVVMKDTWYHVAGVYNGATTSLYVNGVLDTSASWAGGNLRATTATNVLQIGRSAYSTVRAFAGDIDEVRIYKAALTEQEVAALASPTDPGNTIGCGHKVDTVSPQLSVTSHTNGDTVSDSGFVLTGTISDAMEEGAVEVTIYDPILKYVVDSQPATILYPSGNWSLFIAGSQVSANRNIAVTINAFDGDGNVATQSLNLSVRNNDELLQHLTNRISFGLPYDEQDRVLKLGYEGLLAEQLNPGSIAGTKLEKDLAALNVNDYGPLVEYELRYMMDSPWYLQEVMTWFWTNHFSMQFSKLQPTTATAADKLRIATLFKKDNDNYRANALGNFGTLLQKSAESAGMMQYLDNWSNVKGRPNENYARELMELHTLGVNGGYNETTDVAEVARILTGWSIDSTKSNFVFNSANHDTGNKTVMGKTYTGLTGADGKKEGDQLLAFLATHASTAKFVCTKLANLLVSDTPDAVTISDCTAEFLADTALPNQMALVVENLLTSAEMTDPLSLHNKVRSPAEFLVAMQRDGQVITNMTSLRSQISNMGYPMFNYPPPTGMAETASGWLNTFQQAERQNFANGTLRKSYMYYSANVGYLEAFLDNPDITSDDLLTFVIDRMYAGDCSSLEASQLAALLDTDSTSVVSFDINSPLAATSLMTFLGTAMSYPIYLYN